MIVVGLTGSIAMGKTETAKQFASLGIPVFDSDIEVHRQYAEGGEAVPGIAKAFPEAVIDGKVDRELLSRIVVGDPSAVGKLEAIVHPIVRKHQDRFLEECRARGETIALLDIPLLFETGREKELDFVVVVTAPADVQRQRALQRPGMTEKKLEKILSRQTPDSEKRARADFIVDTSKGLPAALAQVREIIANLREKQAKEHP
jgi:dephospho-CoA kinase